jgi:hypothetical protein
MVHFSTTRLIDECCRFQRSCDIALEQGLCTALCVLSASAAGAESAARAALSDKSEFLQNLRAAVASTIQKSGTTATRVWYHWWASSSAGRMHVNCPAHLNPACPHTLAPVDTAIAEASNNRSIRTDVLVTDKWCWLVSISITIIERPAAGLIHWCFLLNNPRQVSSDTISTSASF